MLKRLKNIFASLIITIILLEIALAMLSHMGLIPIIFPTYQLDSPATYLPERSFIYGHRHQPNSSYEIKKNCLHNHYRFNSLGFRGPEMKIKSNKKRILVLGDSFMEGVGVEEDERLSNLMEEKSGLEHINFAMGDKGSTQAFAIYQSIASNYQHDALILSLFPTNDFIDDDPNLAKGENSIRPCWIGEYPNYELKFVPDSAPAKKDHNAIKLLLKNYTFTYNALYYLKELISYKTSAKKFPKTGYFDYEQEQVQRMLFSIQKIKEKAGDKPMLVICIPSQADLLSLQGSNKNFESIIESFCQENNIEFIGLYDIFKKASDHPSTEFYQACDSHWNPAGHQLVAKTLLVNSKIYQSQP